MVKTIKRENPKTWWKLVNRFRRDGALEPSVVEGMPVLVPGRLGDVPVIQLPASATHEQMDAISKAVTEVLGVEPFVTTTNVVFYRFERMSDEKAQAEMQAYAALLASAATEASAVAPIPAGVLDESKVRSA